MLDVFRLITVSYSPKNKKSLWGQATPELTSVSQWYSHCVPQNLKFFTMKFVNTILVVLLHFLFSSQPLSRIGIEFIFNINHQK
jgi:hypothetical protein